MSDAARHRKKVLGGEVAIATDVGGINFKEMKELVEVGQLMARAGPLVHTHGG